VHQITSIFPICVKEESHTFAIHCFVAISFTVSCKHMNL
jgi:hypothetical protein